MSQTYPFDFDPRYRALALPFGVTPARSRVVLTDTHLVVQYGPWRVVTPRANVEAVEQAGPYRLLRTAGPARLSFADRGLTFASNGRRGVCISFREPVVGADPLGRIRSPNLTVTVDDCVGLRDALGSTG